MINDLLSIYIFMKQCVPYAAYPRIQQSVVRHIIRSEAKSDITPLIISLVLCLSKRAIFVDLENGVFTIKQKNPEYFGPEVRGKIIFQKFQSSWHPPLNDSPAFSDQSY